MIFFSVRISDELLLQPVHSQIFERSVTDLRVKIISRQQSPHQRFLHSSALCPISSPLSRGVHIRGKRGVPRSRKSLGSVCRPCTISRSRCHLLDPATLRTDPFGSIPDMGNGCDATKAEQVLIHDLFIHRFSFCGDSGVDTTSLTLTTRLLSLSYATRYSTPVQHKAEQSRQVGVRSPVHLSMNGGRT